MNKRWSSTTKRIVVVGIIILFLVLLNTVRAILPPVIIALIVAYILKPVADFISRTLHVNRTLVVACIYLLLVAVVTTASAILIPTLIEQIEAFIQDVPKIAANLGHFLEQPLTLGEFTLEIQDVYSQVSSSIQSILTSMATQSINILSNIASAIIWIVFILVASFYMVKDAAIIVRWMDEVVPASYRQDFRQLRHRIAASWNAFLRGELILCITMGLVVWITMSLIGLPNAWLIGLLFGVLEFIPNFGPTLASVPTVIIAFFEGSTLLNISNFWFAVIVVGINALLQQLENNILVPRIIGQSLNLHPLIVLIAAVIGARIAGIFGILLAAPMVATLRVLGEYVYYRLLDMPPFPDTIAESKQPIIPAVSSKKAHEPSQVSGTPALEPSNPGPAAKTTEAQAIETKAKAIEASPPLTEQQQAE